MLIRTMRATAVVLTACVSFSAAPVQASTAKERSQARQIKVLKQQVRTLKRANRAATVEGNRQHARHVAELNEYVQREQAFISLADRTNAHLAAVSGERDTFRQRVREVADENTLLRGDLAECQSNDPAS
jgi:hypothetical protein